MVCGEKTSRRGDLAASLVALIAPFAVAVCDFPESSMQAQEVYAENSHSGRI
jgi:hypothetical protein